MFFAQEVWCIADVLSVGLSSEQTLEKVIFQGCLEIGSLPRKRSKYSQKLKHPKFMLSHFVLAKLGFHSCFLSHIMLG